MIQTVRFGFLIGVGALGWAANSTHGVAQTTPDAQGRVRCQVTDNGRDARGTLTLEGGQPVDCADGLWLPPGEHQLSVRLRGSADRATVRRWVVVRPGSSITTRAAFETGELLIQFRRRGRPVPGVGQAWRRGEVRAQVPGERPVRLQAGIYVVEADSEGSRRRFEAVHLSASVRTVLVWELPPAAPVTPSESTQARRSTQAPEQGS